MSVCHCLACQARTGSAFGVQARFRAEDVALAGEATVYTRTGDSGGRITFHFCPTCGSTMWWEIAALPGFIAVPVGAFMDPAFPGPSVAIYEARAHPWVRLAVSEHHG